MTPEPAPPTLAVSFARDETHRWPASWTLSFSVVADTASAADLELGREALEFPAGSAAAGEATLQITALPDPLFAESEEIAFVRLTAGEGSGAVSLGGDLEVAIQDGGVRPCAGIVARAATVAAREVSLPGGGRGKLLSPG